MISKDYKVTNNWHRYLADTFVIPNLETGMLERVAVAIPIGESQVLREGVAVFLRQKYISPLIKFDPVVEEVQYSEITGGHESTISGMEVPGAEPEGPKIEFKYSKPRKVVSQLKPLDRGAQVRS